MSLNQTRTGLLHVVEQLRIAKATLETVTDTVEASQDTNGQRVAHAGSPTAERLVQGTADILVEDLEETIEELERLIRVCRYTVTKSVAVSAEVSTST